MGNENIHEHETRTAYAGQERDFSKRGKPCASDWDLGKSPFYSLEY